MDNIDFSTVTEVTGYNVTEEQIKRIYTRYRFAAEFCDNKDVLEVACGTGQGLGILAKRARKITGGDVDEKILNKAKMHYKDRKNINLMTLDAHKLNFENNSFDVVILYEAVYYLADAGKFVSEAMRVLRENGILLVCTANKELPDFNPSPYSYDYFSAEELCMLLEKNGFSDIRLFGDCPIKEESAKSKIVSLIKKNAVRMHLIPKTMKGKEFFKRLFFGKLHPLPPEIEDGAVGYVKPVSISPHLPNKSYKVIFAIGYKNK